MCATPPLFSIVIPTFNRHRELMRILSSLNRLKSGPDLMEVIVVDDGSEPPVHVNAGAFRYSLKVARQMNTGPAGARNHGAGIAAGDYLLFVDDDCLPDPGWLAGFMAELEYRPEALLGGKTVNGISGNIFSRVLQDLNDYLVKHYSPGRHQGGFFPTNNFCISRSAFLGLEGFEPGLRFGEDREFCFRWMANGFDFAFARNAVMAHAHDLDLLSFVRLHYHYGKGSGHFRRLLRQAGHLVPAYSGPAFYLKLILYPGLCSPAPMMAVPACVLMATAQIANALGVLFVSVTGR